MPLSVLLVEDHTLIRASLRALLEKQPDINVVGEIGDGQKAVDLAEELSPDIVLMDIMLRGSQVSGMQATQKIMAANPETKVIALSVMEDLTYVKRMLSAGACGYLFKGCTEDELVEAVRTVVSGKSYFSEEMLQVIQEDYVTTVQSEDGSAQKKLTARELEILQRIASGDPSKSIASDLNISRKTVDAHKRNIMEKLNIWSIAELTQYAMREGIIGEDE
ncbi:MAG: response regulator [bacterium]